MMGSIDAWFYKNIAGIQLDEDNPAFASFIVKPQLLDSLHSPKAQIETMRGMISSEWERKSGQFTLKVHVPFNTSATIYIPGKEGGKVTEAGLPLKHMNGATDQGFFAGYRVVHVPSGNYEFKSEL